MAVVEGAARAVRRAMSPRPEGISGAPEFSSQTWPSGLLGRTTGGILFPQNRCVEGDASVTVHRGRAFQEVTTAR